MAAGNNHNRGTLISSAIRPNNLNDKIATAYAKEIKGGLHTVKDLSDMYLIFEERREWGMLCYVINEDKYYKLEFNLIDQDITNNNNWIEFNSGSSGGYIQNYVDVNDVIYIPPHHQYFVYGNLENHGTIKNDGQIVIADGAFIDHGTYIANSHTNMNYGGEMIFISIGGLYSEPVYEHYSIDGTYSGVMKSNDIITYKPARNSRIEVFVNGKKETLSINSNTYSNCWFEGTSSIYEATPLNELNGGEYLVWNSYSSGYNLTYSDSVEIIYETFECINLYVDMNYVNNGYAYVHCGGSPTGST